MGDEAKDRPRTAATGAERWRDAAPTCAAIAATVVLPRLLVLNISVIDWDESIYALIGQQWLAGHVPHETVYDHKPAGLFAIFALFQFVFGDSVLAVRMIPIVFVGATAAILARIAWITLGQGRWTAALAAALYGMLTLANGGFASNTEILVNLFVVLAVFLLLAQGLDQRVSATGSLAVGASLGLAFQVNFLSGVLIAGVAAFYLVWMVAREPVAAIVARYFANGALMLAGFVAAGAIMTLPIALYGNLPDYLGMKLAYLGGYPGIDEISVALRRVSEALVPHWPFWAIFALLCVAAARGSEASEGWWAPAAPRDARILGWLTLCLFALLAAIASRRFYQHFFLFATPPLVLLAVTFARLVRMPDESRPILGLALLLFSVAAPVSAQEIVLQGIRARLRACHGLPADPIAGTGRYLSERLRPGETIYVFDGQPILYFMTRTVPPTRFAFPESHLREDVAARLGLAPREEVRGILERKPRFIVAQPGPSGLGISAAGVLLKEALDRDYVRARALEPAAPEHVYMRKDAASPGGVR